MAIKEFMRPSQRSDTHLGVAEELVVDVFCDAHLLQARVGERDPDRLDVVLDLEAEGEDDRRGEEVRVREEHVLERAEVARARGLCEAPLGRAAADAAVLGLPDLDAELLGGEGVAEEGLRDGVREGDAREAVGVLGRARPEVLDRGEGLVVVVSDVEGVGSVRAVEVGAVEQADGTGGRLRCEEGVSRRLPLRRARAGASCSAL